MLPKQSNLPNNGTFANVFSGSTGVCESSGLLSGHEIEALLCLFTLLDQWDREEARREE